MGHTKRQGDMIGPNVAIWATLGNFGRKIVAQKCWLLFIFYISPLFISFNAWFDKYFLATLGIFSGIIEARKVATFLATFHILHCPFINSFNAWFCKYFLATLGIFSVIIVAPKVATFLASFHILHFPLINSFNALFCKYFWLLWAFFQG
jgi:hypothetical protein